MCHADKDILFCREVMMAVPMEVLVYMEGFHCTQRLMCCQVPRKWVSDEGMDPSLMKTSVVYCMCRSMELMYCKNNWLCSACCLTRCHAHI